MSYGGISQASFNSFYRDRQRDHKYAWELQTHGGDAAVDRARGITCTNFLKSPSNVLVMADHDLSWNVGAATYLAEKAHETQGVVGALVSKRAYGQGWGCRLVDGCPHEIGSEELVLLEEDAYVGGAFIAISRAVLERMTKVLPMVYGDFYPFFIPQLKHNNRIDRTEYLSEDWSFIHGARVTGSPCYLAMYPTVVHHGDTGFTTISGYGGAVEMDADGSRMVANG